MNSFATTTYADAESSGPPSAPLGFPAPHVLKADIAPVKYFDSDSSKWKEGTALQAGGEVDTAYLFTAICLKQTICGVVMRGIVLRRRKLEVTNECNETKGSNDGVSAKLLNIQLNEVRAWEKTSQYVAIKVDKRSVIMRLHNGKTTHRNPENPWKEISVMQLLGSDHPNIVTLLSAFSDDQSLYEVMHYCSGGNLSTFVLHHHPQGVPEAQAKAMFQQILDGVYYMHSKGVCHHDLSTNNIMLDGDDNTCIIIDFGMSLRVPYSYPDDPGYTDDVTDISIGTNRRLIHTHTFCGKMHFVAPEIYQKAYKFDGLAADIWSLGVILFVLLTGKQPYERPDDNDEGFHDLIDPSYYWDASRVDPCLSWGKVLSREVVDLLRNMLCPDPKHRASLGWITMHEWFNDATKMQ